MPDTSKEAVSTAPRAIYLKDYLPPAYLIDTVHLHFELGEEVTRVKAHLALHSNYPRTQGLRPLVLDGQDLVLRSIALDGRTLEAHEYRIEPESLTLDEVPGSFLLDIETELKPQENTSLEGLYKSSGNFCTQCEAEGFRKITYFLDRPDVMARYTTTIVADKTRYPVLLSNGNCIEAGELDGNRHWAQWDDPFKKPAYLYALVAGDLVRVDGHYTTRSGRQVALQIYVQAHNVDKCDHAMRSLQQAMRWDEEVYGREYDLDVYMIVAVDDFNMGAMENKGLNVFNTKYVLAKPETATDSDFEHIQGVIGHEYFHNWSGNRVTCRDWFQLSLKEGFTVFRDQQFSADMTSPAVKRIHDVTLLRTHQFAEDAGPMAHPVRPASYVEINNFYTSTVYNKGAEVVRMLHTLLGQERFRKGTDLYFARHDGQAVTTDDFVQAMADANGVDLTQFKRWYDQAGTPELAIETTYEAAHKAYTVKVTQTCPPTPGQAHKEPFHIPLAIGLLDQEGRDLPLELAGEPTSTQSTTRVLEIREREQSFRFTNVPETPIPSLLRGFSAPVKLVSDTSDEALSFLMVHDSDAFNRWEAGQRLASRIILRLITAHQNKLPLRLAHPLIVAFRETLEHTDLDKALMAEALSLPAEAYLAQQMEVIDPEAIYATRLFVRRTLARELKDRWLKTYMANRGTGPYRIDNRSIAQRRLKNLCLGYLMELDETEVRSLCMQQYRDANNMTDVISALGTLTHTDCPERTEALEDFYTRWQGNALVVDKWFSLQATSHLPTTLEQVKALVDHPAFTLTNPNRMRALIGAFCHGNPVRFHEASGAGYAFLTDNVITLDALNPQVAARLVGALSRWRKYQEPLSALMRTHLERILQAPNLSHDVYEIVTKSLGD